MVVPRTKICSHCKARKPWVSFYLAKGKRLHECIVCRCARNKYHYALAKKAGRLENLKSLHPFAQVVVHRKAVQPVPPHATDGFIKHMRDEADAKRSPADYLAEHKDELPPPKNRLAGLEALKKLTNS